jgi:OOP family OmpA-OmpF porin
MYRSILTTLALAAAALFAGAAQAQQGPSGVVLGVAGGISQFNDNCEGTSRCDKSDRAIRFNAGYGLGNGLVIEAVSFNFGKLKGAVPVFGGVVDLEIGATAFGGGAAYHMPAGSSSSLFFRLGVAQVKTKVNARGALGSFSDSDSHTTAYAGLGFGWNFSQNAALELAWETTQFKFEDTKESVSAATVGLRFSF